MNVLFYREIFLNKSETFIANYCKQQGSDAGMDIHFLSHYVLPEAIKALGLEDVKNLHAPLGGNAILYKIFRRLGTDAYQIAHKRKAIGKIAAIKNYDVLHAHFGYEGWHLLPAAKHWNKPLVTTFYGHDLSSIPRENPKWKDRYRELFEYGSRFVVEGKFMKQALKELGCPGEKIEILPIAIDLGINQFTNRIEDFSAMPEVHILMVGRFVEKKGFAHGINAFRLLKEKTDRRVVLHIVGGGPDEEKLRRLIAEYNLESQVIFHGFLNYTAYQDLLRQISICLVPSHTASDGETEGGAPTVLLEMQARGIPVVATRHADIPNVVPAGYEYLAAEKGDEELAEKTLRLMEQKDMMPHLQRSRQFIEQYHDVVKSAGRLAQIYSSL